jgi:hypothetical protein
MQSSDCLIAEGVYSFFAAIVTDTTEEYFALCSQKWASDGLLDGVAVQTVGSGLRNIVN